MRISKRTLFSLTCWAFVIFIAGFAIIANHDTSKTKEGTLQNIDKEYLNSLTAPLIESGVHPGMRIDGRAALVYACKEEQIREVVDELIRVNDTQNAVSWLEFYIWVLEVAPGCHYSFPAPPSYQAFWAYEVWMSFSPKRVTDAKRAARKYAEFVLDRYRKGDGIVYVDKDGLYRSNHIRMHPQTLEDALGWFERAGATKEELQKIRKTEERPYKVPHERRVWKKIELVA